MKKLLLASTITALSFTSILLSPIASANGVEISRSICEYVAIDDKKRMRSLLKSKKLRIRGIFSQIRCNGQNLLEFAQTAGSVNTGSLVISKLPKKVVAEQLAILQSGTPLFDVANKRVSS